MNQLAEPITTSSVPLTGEVIRSLDAYRATGGLRAWEYVKTLSSEEVLDMIGAAGLRGRGGAGFPVALKWRGIRDQDAARKFVCCNGAEGEPGTYKDRYLLSRNPYRAIEGLAIAKYVMGAEAAFLCVKELFRPLLEGLPRALAEMQATSDLADDIEIVWGPDEYLFGEEKALCSVVEGGLPLPRVLPPYMHGLFVGAFGGPDGNPTCVNNVETLSHIPNIINEGPEWFRSMGSKDTPGTMVFTVIGDVERPFVGELPLGMTLLDLIYDVAGGPPAGRQVKAVFPGLANAVIVPSQLSTPLGFDSMRLAGSALGSGGFIVYDDTVCMVKVAERFVHFLHVESCNQCPPCKIGSRSIKQRLEHLLAGHATAQEIDDIEEEARWVTNGGRCYLPTSTSLVASSILASYPQDFEAHMAGTCTLRHDIAIPKITGYDSETGFTLDLEYDRKQPDWTYV